MQYLIILGVLYFLFSNNKPNLVQRRAKIRDLKNKINSPNYTDEEKAQFQMELDELLSK